MSDDCYIPTLSALEKQWAAFVKDVVKRTLEKDMAWARMEDGTFRSEMNPHKIFNVFFPNAFTLDTHKDKMDEYGYIDLLGRYTKWDTLYPEIGEDFEKLSDFLLNGQHKVLDAAL